MAERQTPPPRGRQQGDYRGSGQRRQAPPRRNDVIRCENCGEDYSVTYKRCPFCDERPGASGRRAANTRGGGYGRPASALKTASWIGSFVVVLAAMFIIYRFMGAPLFGGGRHTNSGGDISSSQSGVSSNPGGSTSQPGGDVSTPDPGQTDPVPVNEVQGTIIEAGSGLNVRSGPGRDNDAVDKIANGVKVIVLGVENGWYQIRYDGDKTGYVSKDYVSTSSDPVTVEPPVTVDPPKPQQPDPPVEPGGPVTPGTQGTIVNVENGLNIRSGPGTTHSKVASASSGAQVVILGEEDGWYQIRYSGNDTGYVMKEYVSIP